MIGNCGIYKIECFENGKKYIGASSDLKTRWNNHKIRLKRDEHYNKNLQDDFNLFGLNSFEFSAILICDFDNLGMYEKQIIDFHQNKGNFLYNTKNDWFHFTEEILQCMSVDSKGERNGMYGKSSPNRGVSLSDNTKKRMSEAHKGKLGPNCGKTFSDNTKRKMSISKKNDNNPFYNKSHSNETKRYLSKINSGDNNPRGMLGKKHRKVICEYCDKEIPYPNYIQYHGLKCKYKSVNVE